MELWVSVAKGEYDGDLGSDTQQSGEERALGKGLRAVIEKSRWSDSNRRPLTYKARALPLSYIGTRTVYHRWSRCAPKTIQAIGKLGAETLVSQLRSWYHYSEERSGKFKAENRYAG